MAREFMKVVFKHSELIKDPLITGYVNRVGNRIVSVLPPQPFDYRFYVIKDDNYNAFAGPAGNIFINSGLFKAMENEEELAGVLAHEIAHVKCRHLAQRIEKSSKIRLATIAGIAAGILLGIGGVETAANVLTTGSTAVAKSIFLAYSREDEMQADKIGLRYLTKAGYSGEGLPAILKRIRGRQWFGPEQIPTYLTTHPALEERILYIDTWLENNAKTGQPPNQKFEIDPYDFKMAHTRLVAMYGEKDAALRRFEKDVCNHPTDPAAHYGYGLILARTGSREGAIIHLKTALEILEKKTFDSYILRDLGRIYFLDGQYEKALYVLERVTSIAPSDPEGLFFLGRTKMMLGRYKEAATVFENIIKKHPDYVEALYFLGKSYGRQGRLNDAHYHLGVYFKNRNEFENAIFHLKRVLRNIDDPDKKLEIEKMLGEIKILISAP